jgi:hypothetical protein
MGVDGFIELGLGKTVGSDVFVFGGITEIVGGVGAEVGIGVCKACKRLSKRSNISERGLTRRKPSKLDLAFSTSF